MKRNKNIRFIGQIQVFFVLMLFNSAYSVPLFGEVTEQDTIEQSRNAFAYFPIIFYTPETKMAGGAAVSYYYRESESEITSRPSTIMPVMIYTQKKQIISELYTDLYWKDEIYHLTGHISYSKFPDKFYGIGNNTSEDDEENYTPRSTRLFMNLQKKVHSGFNLGIQYEFEHNKIIEVEENGLLAKGDICGSEGGTASGSGILLSWDTRNNIFYPSSGSFYQSSASLFSSALGSDYNFTRYNIDFRQYFTLLSSHILAFQAYMNFITGDTPFQMLSLFGGQNMMRGYYNGRYRDKNMIVFQTEYHIPVWRRFGLAGFMGIGDVADDVDNFELGNFKYSVGWGIRYLFSPKEGINLRLDFGFGEGSFGFYITLGEAF